MSILVYTPRPATDSQASHLFHQVLDHLQERWPGTFTLACCHESPAETTPNPALDWVVLPDPSSGWAQGLDADLLAGIGDSFESRAVLFIGLDAAGFLRSCEPGKLGPRILMLPSGEQITGSPAEQQLTLVAGEGPADLLGRLDRQLAGLMPVEIFCGPDDTVDDIQVQLGKHAARETARQVVVHWRGVADQNLADAIHAVTEVIRAPIHVDLLLSEMMDIPRTWLTPTPLDFVKNPKAWWQLGRFVRLAATTPAGVHFTISTDSRRKWVHAGVAVANAFTGIIRLPRKLGKGSDS